MGDISAREPKGHNILAVERFRDNTRWMIKFAACQPPYGSPSDEMRLFLIEDGYHRPSCWDIKIKQYACVIEGHILDFKPKKHRCHP